MMPEKVTIGVDYLSGDVTPQNGVYRSAFEARCLAPQGKPWDLMAWGFSWDGGKMPMSVKSAVQLEQEAAQIMAMGGGVQFYFQQNRDLSLKPWLATTLAEIGQFCRARQPYCQKSVAVPQIALLYPSVSYQRNASRPYSNPTGRLEGALNLILDNQHPVEILMEHHLTGKMDQYPLIIIPECDYLEPAFLDELKRYLGGGGTILTMGTETARMFEKELGISSLNVIAESQAFIEADGKIGAIRSALDSVALNKGVEIISTFYNGSDFSQKGNMTASSSNIVGKGKISAVYFNAGSAYNEYKSPVLRDFIDNRIAELFPGEMVQVSGSHLVHVTINKLNSNIYVNLINVAGEHTGRNAIGYDEIPSIKNLTVSVKTMQKPSRILLQPEGRELEVSFNGGTSSIVVPELPIHSILEIIP
jgi:hypothetical protein